MPKVSVLMNCLNGEKYVKQAIDSVYAQTYTDWEIIFIDNASTDNTAHIANSYDSRLKYYRNEHTLPLYHARNIGLQYVTGDFLAFLDVDDTWVPDKLTRQLTVMQTYPHVYLTCAGFFRQEKVGELTKHVLRKSMFLSFHYALDRYPINIATVLIRLDQYSKPLVKFESSLNLTGDYELFMKLIYRFSAYYLAEGLATYRLHEKNLSARLKHDWPREILATHKRWENELDLSDIDKKHAEKRYLRAESYLHMANGRYKAVRQLTKKYLGKDSKLTLIYLASFNRLLSQQLLKLRGF